ncbi:MAG: UDP-N-acetylmuramate--L-alanine ligase [candidate division Zixibacteria bacterium]|nr:UDP-N-acetylmuramate--L-alanine ligase [candidate division Zixibacteria bacterium]MDH4033630.1 UDP-N-acetylmuramate--L-alanine ligase [candidate division Zixibacteria bacterium]
MFGKYKKLFFVGIGGAGMSGIAELLFNLEFDVRGSDLATSDVTDYLVTLGVKVHQGHSAENLEDADLVVISSAVSDDNPEVMAARDSGIPVIKRAEMLGELMRLKRSIGVSGTHGKTTTTSMIGSVLRHADYDPTIIVGGVVAGLGSGAALGKGDYLVAEADEYDRSFLAMYPTVAVVTNIEADHLDCYDGMDHLLASFVTYMNRVPFYGSVIISADDANLALVRPEIARPMVTFGFDATADYRATDVKLVAGRTRFTVWHIDELLGEVSLSVPGRHNVLNALAAVAACREVEVPMSAIAEGLASFGGVRRRFEIIGEFNEVILVDDYAHHPTEIAATLTTARETYGRRVIVVYQPHLYSRTRDFAGQFAESLSIADECLLTDIYPAREEPIEGVTSELIARRAGASEGARFSCIGPRSNVAAEVMKLVRKGDMIIIMGAGSITLACDELKEALKTL